MLLIIFQKIMLKSLKINIIAFILASLFLQGTCLAVPHKQIQKPSKPAKLDSSMTIIGDITSSSIMLLALNLNLTVDLIEKGIWPESDNIKLLKIANSSITSCTNFVLSDKKADEETRNICGDILKLTKMIEEECDMITEAIESESDNIDHISEKNKITLKLAREIIEKYAKE